MSKKSLRNLAVAGVLAFTPSLASAFTGTLVHCAPAGGIGVQVTLSPGLACDAALNKITVAATAKTGNQLSGCAANGSAPWDLWSAGKVGSKITGADAANISKADITIKATTFGSCNFGGSAASYKASGAGKLTFYAADGITKVKGGANQFYVGVAGDIPTQSALALGIVTKKFGVGAAIEVQIGIDLAGPSLCGATQCNGLILACNTGGICPPDPFGPTQPPITFLDLKTNVTSYVEMGFPDNALCTAPGLPWKCCSGAGAGTCA